MTEGLTETASADSGNTKYVECSLFNYGGIQPVGVLSATAKKNKIVFDNNLLVFVVVHLICKVNDMPLDQQLTLLQAQCAFVPTHGLNNQTAASSEDSHAC